MVAQGLFSIGGIASGLDTENIVSQLMQLERQPIVRIEQQQNTLASTKEAWGQLNTRLSSVRSATDKLRRPDSFANLTKVTSSDPSAVAVTKGSGFTGDADLSFSVSQLATRMQTASLDEPGQLFSSRDELLDGRTLSITIGDETHDLTGDLGSDATLADLVAAVNAADIGVNASAVEVRSGEFRLVLDAEHTGSDGAFSVATTWDGGPGDAWLGETQTAQDAVLTQGGVEITRGSNTITDLVPGATITLNETTTQPVTVRAERDIDAAVANVTGFVDAVNNVIKTVSELTDYDPETGQSGALQGEFGASRIAFDLRAAVTAPIAGLTGSGALASTVGLSADRDGVLQLDEAALRQAFTDDFDGTTARFSRTGEVSDTEVATSVSGSRATQPGTYEMEISKAATVARQVGAYYGPAGSHQPKNFMISVPGGKVVSVQIDTDTTSTSGIRDRIQQALDEAGVTNLVAGLDTDVAGDQALTLETTAYGSRAAFEVWAVDEEGEPIDVADDDVYGLASGEPIRGTDVEGRIGDEIGIGSGRLLRFDSGDVQGLNVQTAADLSIPEGGTATADVSFWQGIGGVMDRMLDRMEGSGGTIARAQNQLDSRVRFNQDRIDQYERRIESREVTLRRQFVAMEQALDRANAQGEWLSGQLNQLSAINAQGR